MEDNSQVYVGYSEKDRKKEPVILEEESLNTIVEEKLPENPQPLSIQEIIDGLRGFGIEENEEILTFTNQAGRKIRLRITNLPTDEEIKALVTAEEFKGYAWIQRIRVEVLSRSISWVDGIDIRALKQRGVPVKDVDGVMRDIQVVLRNTILGWGQELVMTLWKIAMVHSDKLEKKYQADFPDSVLMTDYERRFLDTVMKELDDSNKDVIADSLQQIFDPDKEEVS